MPELEFPTVEELFGPKPRREPHPDILAAEARYVNGETPPAMEVADRECARLLMNHCLFHPPITDEEINAYAKKFSLPFRDAEIELRELRNEL